MRPRGTLLVVLAVVTFFAATLLLVRRQQVWDSETFAPGSVFNEGPEGLSLAHRYLEKRAAERHASVGLLTEPLHLAPPPPNAVLLRIQPRRPWWQELKTSLQREGDDERDGGGKKKDTGNDKQESQKPGTQRPRRQAKKPRPGPGAAHPQHKSVCLSSQDEQWVRDGGRLVLGLEDDCGEIQIRKARPQEQVRKVFPLWPAVRKLGVSAPPRVVTGPWGAVAPAVFSSESGALLARQRIGRGDLWVLAMPELLDNAHLAQADRLALLEALAPEGRPVVFDEAAHGYGESRGLVGLLLDWSLGPALVAFALGLGLVLWRGRTRIGPEEDDHRESRTEAVDLVDSLGQLYERALSRREAAQMYTEAYRRAVALRTGLHGAPLEARLQEMAGASLELPEHAEQDLPASVFRRHMDAINQGFRRLYDHAHPLRSR